MSLLPYIFDNEWPWPRRNRVFNQDFGLALTPEDVLSPVVRGSGDFYKPFRQLAQMTQDLGSNIKSDKDKFQVNVDVQHFAPEEISVKTADGQLIIEGKHEEKQDEHGYISRQFVRRYALPEGCVPENVQSKLSSDGVLTVVAPKQHLAVKGERAVPIQHTGPVRKQIQDTPSTSDAKK
ncbi:protein lethal(2)essential for life-like [Pectinophora gossypiella]|uniref:protein lethal(2)essential for life-like n=1 Tax=Pectinophora gossypiella TaxID=13191 RepID=UPI00214F2326|nr:protein lethal(2)essential for life-like [Pectinophora gossypiella]